MVYTRIGSIKFSHKIELDKECTFYLNNRAYKMLTKRIKKSGSTFCHEQLKNEASNILDSFDIIEFKDLFYSVDSNGEVFVHVTKVERIN